MIKCIIFFFYVFVSFSKRFCIFQQDNKQTQSTIPYIVRAATNLLTKDEANLLKREEKLYHYKPHYLHSYSYPQPITPHFYYGQLNNDGRPVFFVKENQTFRGEDVVEDMFYINAQKQEQMNENILESGKLETKSFKFIAVLQIQNMFEKNVETSLVMYNMGHYFGFICDLGEDFKAFTMHFLDSEINVLKLQEMMEDLRIYIRNHSTFNNKQSWKNGQTINWVGKSQIDFEKNLKTPILFNTFVMELHYQSKTTARRIKVHFRQFPKKHPDQKIQELLKRMENISEEQLKKVKTGFRADFSCGLQAQRQLLRGMSYQYGTLVLKNGSRSLKNEPKQLLSFSPSRKRFPWGFLWDDGFHCQVAARNHPQISLKVIKSWLDTMIQTGWIPREQNRGKEREYLCSCPRFMAKDIRDGNPPTLILALHYLAKKNLLNSTNFEKESWDKLKKWYNWFLQTQQTGKNSFIFRWHDSIPNEGSFNSGMDDFPRMPNTQGHVDCQAWMYLFSKVLSTVSPLYGEDASTYQNNAQQIKLKLYQNFIDDDSGVCNDYGFDQFKKKVYNQNFGYPSILPLAFGMLDEDTPVFNETLNTIRHDLDGGHGLASISMKNRHYLENRDAYWRGPVWININYLVLKGLREHYPSFSGYYEKLREDLMKTVCGNFQKKGYFYENYIKGQGSFSYPFTGWTTLISIIIAEKY